MALMWDAKNRLQRAECSGSRESCTTLSTQYSNLYSSFRILSVQHFPQTIDSRDPYEGSTIWGLWFGTQGFQLRGINLQGQF